MPQWEKNVTVFAGGFCLSVYAHLHVYRVTRLLIVAVPKYLMRASLLAASGSVEA